MEYYKDYYRTIRAVAKELYENAKSIVNEEKTNNATCYYDNYLDDYEEQFMYEECFETLLHYEIMRYDDVIQCDINSMKENDVCIVFNDEV